MQLAIFLLAFVILAGAWLGFWVVRKLVLTEDGSIDVSTSLFVAWSIRILAAVMILQVFISNLLSFNSSLSINSYLDSRDFVRIFSSLKKTSYLTSTCSSQSSADPLLATEALLFGITVSSILRKIFKLRFLRRMHK